MVRWRKPASVVEHPPTEPGMRPPSMFPSSPVNGTVPTSCTADGDVAGAGGEAGVVGEVGEQLAGAGGVQDDVLDAGVEAVEVEDVGGGGRVVEPVTDVFDPVGGGRDGGAAVRAGGQVQVAERVDILPAMKDRDSLFRWLGRSPGCWVPASRTGRCRGLHRLRRPVRPS